MSGAREEVVLSARDLTKVYQMGEVEVHALGGKAQQAAEIPHIGTRSILGGKALVYEDVPRGQLAEFGELRTPSVSDLFMAKVGG